MATRRTLLTALTLGPVAGMLTARVAAQTAAVRLGVAQADTFGEGYYADALGLFRDGGLNVTLVPLSTGSQISAAVVGGAVDVGISNTVELANAVSHGVPFVFIAGGGLSDSSAQLVVAQHSPVRTAKDLEGKTVSVQSLNDLTQIAPCAWMEQNGADYRSVRFVEIHFPEVAAALARSTVDAGMLAEPFLSAAGDKLRVVANVMAAIAPLFLVSAFFTTRDYAARNPDTVRRFASVIGQTARWANAHHEQSAEILAKYTKLDLASLKTMKRTSYALSLDPTQIQPLFSVLYAFHTIQRPLSAGDVLIALH